MAEVQVWTCRRRPPSSGEASQWLQQNHAHMMPARSMLGVVNKLAVGAAQLIAAPHAPPVQHARCSGVSRWSKFAGAGQSSASTLAAAASQNSSGVAQHHQPLQQPAVSQPSAYKPPLLQQGLEVLQHPPFPALLHHPAVSQLPAVATASVLHPPKSAAPSLGQRLRAAAAAAAVATTAPSSAGLQRQAALEHAGQQSGQAALPQRGRSAEDVLALLTEPPIKPAAPHGSGSDYRPAMQQQHQQQQQQHQQQQQQHPSKQGSLSRHNGGGGSPPGLVRKRSLHSDVLRLSAQLPAQAHMSSAAAPASQGSAWQQRPTALQAFNQGTAGTARPKQQKAKQGSGASAGDMTPPSGGSRAAEADAEQPPGAGKRPRKQATAAAAHKGKGGKQGAAPQPSAAATARTANEAEQGQVADPEAKPAKRQRKKAALEPREPAAEQLDIGAMGVVLIADQDSTGAFEREMSGAAGCSCGLLLLDGTSGSQFYSTLQPLTKQQQKRIKAAAAGSSKKRRQSSKEAFSPNEGSGAEDAAGRSSVAPAAGSRPLVVGLCLLPVHLSQEGACTPSSSMYFLPLAPGTTAGLEVPQEAVQYARGWAATLLGAQTTAVCFSMQEALRLLHLAGGVAIPPVPALSHVADPHLLGWLAEPHLLQEKELSDYGLAALCSRHLDPQTAALAVAQTESQGPLERTRSALLAAHHLGEVLLWRLQAQALPHEALQREMQVAALLAELEAVGLGFDPWLLQQQGQQARGHQARLEAQAAAIAGREFNLASSSQLATVLYEDLGLPAPTSHARGSAKTHLPTDEAALKQLQQYSELPGLILQYRAISNFLSKWVQPAWVAEAADGQPSAQVYLAAHGNWPRVRCSWNQTQTATGRLSSSSPNLQAVTKYSLEAAGAAQLINVRDAFVASQGCLLLAADYSQVELRVLAHLSGDQALVDLLRQADAAGDAFQLIARAWLGAGQHKGEVSKEERDKAKRIVYGLIYGLSAYGLAQGSGGLQISVSAAQDLIKSFLNRFSGVKSWLEGTRAAARQSGCVRTMAGRVRPISGLASSDRRLREEAERKSVNSTVQGSAADIIKIAMLRWAEWVEAQGRPPVRLLAQIHDELIFEVDTRAVDLHWAVAGVREVMEGAASLSVPLVVNIKAGSRWGSLQPLGSPLPPDFHSGQQH